MEQLSPDRPPISVLDIVVAYFILPPAFSLVSPVVVVLPVPIVVIDLVSFTLVGVTFIVVVGVVAVFILASCSRRGGAIGKFGSVGILARGVLESPSWLAHRWGLLERRWAVLGAPIAVGAAVEVQGC